LAQHVTTALGDVYYPTLPFGGHSGWGLSLSPCAELTQEELQLYAERARNFRWAEKH
jgi:hypothetical protein